jgi:protein required for attachment to host cells
MSTQYNWLVVANGSRARVLEQADVPGGCTSVAALVHPQTRQKGVELAAQHGGDRPGHVEGTGHGLGSAAYQPRTDPRERERQRFAREVAAVLNRGVASGRCGGLIVMASDPFLGELKAELDGQATKRLLRTQAVDHTAMSDAELARAVGWLER